MRDESWAHNDALTFGNASAVRHVGVTAPPWTRVEGVSVDLGFGPLPVGTASEMKRVAERHLASLPHDKTWMWTVGSAEGGVENGGAGALVVRPGDEESELRVPAGRLCSSSRAEMVALNAALQWLLEQADEDPDDPVVICTDS